MARRPWSKSLGFLNDGACSSRSKSSRGRAASDPAGSDLRIGAGRSPLGQRTAGFTLLEVLVAMGILAIALVALLGLHAKNVGMTVQDQNFTRATLLARDLISEIQFQAMVQGIDAVRSSGGAFEGFPGFRYEMQIDSTDFDDVKRVHLRVIWDERRPDACQVLYFVRGEVL